ncbi:MAG: nucleotidyltransferase domain-containing protein [Kiritimatiellae bacterium]|nr:nucleotidyltransferase domain-containing protein [Kiritimatiellia bacterium]
MNPKVLARSNTRAVVERRRAEWLQRLENELARMVEILRNCPGVHRVYVFGSFGRGEARWRSDLDLVVVQETNLRMPDRIQSLLSLLRPRIQTDVLVFTPGEWNDPARASLVRRVEGEGRLLYVAPR